ncbi:MAG: ribbon-helix-helix domain-containing protein [Candidatus Acidiferrum sp.]
MRITIEIDDELVAAAKELAAKQGKVVGKIISELARQALKDTSRTRNGIPLLPVRPGSVPVTPRLVNRLRDKLT